MEDEKVTSVMADAAQEKEKEVIASSKAIADQMMKEIATERPVDEAAREREFEEIVEGLMAEQNAVGFGIRLMRIERTK
jgi:hypothetical protein